MRWTVPAFAVCPQALQSQLLTDIPMTLAEVVWTDFGRKQICLGRNSGSEHQAGKPEVGSCPGCGTTWCWDLGQVATLTLPSSLWFGGVKPRNLKASVQCRCPVTLRSAIFCRRQTCGSPAAAVRGARRRCVGVIHWLEEGKTGVRSESGPCPDTSLSCPSAMK